MNQILFSEAGNSAGGGRPVNTKTDITTIVRFFCIFVIVFGLTLTGTGVYAFLQGGDISGIADTTKKPVIQVQRLDEGTLTVVVNHNQSIYYLEYNWNGEDPERVYAEQRSNIQEIIEIIPGNNLLSILVVDVSGNESIYEQEYYYAVEGDIEKPKIDLEVIGNYVKVEVTDDTEIKYMSYKWNEEEETVIQADGNNKKIITTQIEVRKGENKLTVKAVDSTGNSWTEDRTYRGVTKPTIDVGQDGNSLVIVVEDVEGIKYIDIDLNEQRLRIQPPEVQNKIEYVIAMEPGNNILTVVAYSTNGENTKFEGQAATF